MNYHRLPSFPLFKTLSALIKYLKLFLNLKNQFNELSATYLISNLWILHKIFQVFSLYDIENIKHKLPDTITEALPEIISSTKECIQAFLGSSVHYL